MIDLLEIKDPSFIKDMSIKELKELAWQIREFLVDHISKTGGHLSSNLGVVEITIAMYYVFDPEKDKFLFDVGHQSYVHKILTGRAKDFENLRQFGGMSGYIRREESKYDIWESGHSSTTISAMAGMLIGNENKSEKVVSLIGDSSIMNGVAFEGLNFLGSQSKLAPIIILNDNKMGISKSVGALSKALSRLRGTRFWRGFKRVLNFIFPTFITNRFHQLKRGVKAFIQHDNIFEDLGFDYYGPIKGNDLRACIKALQRVQKNTEPVILHVITQKGKGYAPSELDQEGSFHGVGPFDKHTGKSLKVLKPNECSYSEVVSHYLKTKRETEQFYVVTPAMKAGAKLEKFAESYPNDFYDVGIAEEHAADMAAGMALKDKKVVLLYYSTFSQRAFDQVLNDIARQNLPVIIGIDRAGVVGEDGATHQGIYDIAMFKLMPNMTIAMPRNPEELVGIFNYAFTHQGPIVIRYPRGCVIQNLYTLDYKNMILPSWEFLKRGHQKCVISYGPDVERFVKLAEENEIDCSILDARYIRPMDLIALEKALKTHDQILVIEQTTIRGSLYEDIVVYAHEHQFTNKIESISFAENLTLPHGKIQDVLDHYGMSNEDIIKKMRVD
ncbi:MAG: 1-deoxy-D-xylulose-5-phosphate synthase [Anaeroplasmataceae bacterium]|nr:1-deoxy-D-xylulose-5-phosphate synthase [Anaeroplasmataceae bacterium]